MRCVECSTCSTHVEIVFLDSVSFVAAMEQKKIKGQAYYYLRSIVFVFAHATRCDVWLFLELRACDSHAMELDRFGKRTFLAAARGLILLFLVAARLSSWRR